MALLHSSPFAPNGEQRQEQQQLFPTVEKYRLHVVGMGVNIVNNGIGARLTLQETEDMNAARRAAEAAAEVAQNDAADRARHAAMQVAMDQKFTPAPAVAPVEQVAPAEPQSRFAPVAPQQEPTPAYAPAQETVRQNPGYNFPAFPAQAQPAVAGADVVKESAPVFGEEPDRINEIRANIDRLYAEDAAQDDYRLAA